MKLPCGCKPGKFLCKTAEMLWAYHSALYRAGLPVLSAHFRAEYDAHYSNTEKTLEESIRDSEGVSDA